MEPREAGHQAHRYLGTRTCPKPQSWRGSKLVGLAKRSLCSRTEDSQAHLKCWQRKHIQGPLQWILAMPLHRVLDRMQVKIQLTQQSDIKIINFHVIISLDLKRVRTAARANPFIWLDNARSKTIVAPALSPNIVTSITVHNQQREKYEKRTDFGDRQKVQTFLLSPPKKLMFNWTHCRPAIMSLSPRLTIFLAVDSAPWGKPSGPRR